MTTLTVTTPTGDQYTLPLMQAMDAAGCPVPLSNDTLAVACDHAGQTWSQDFDLRCTRCGSRLFLPASRLAHIEARILERMYLLWRAAGWPQWWDGAWCGDAPRIDHPYFAAFEGIPVEPERQWDFREVAASFILTDMEATL